MQIPVVVYVLDVEFRYWSFLFTDIFVHLSYNNETLETFIKSLSWIFDSKDYSLLGEKANVFIHKTLLEYNTTWFIGLGGKTFAASFVVRTLNQFPHFPGLFYTTSTSYAEHDITAKSALNVGTSEFMITFIFALHLKV